jgi:hypothetical protein
MPNRIIREGLNHSLRINALSEAAELFYRKLQLLVDDFGRYEAEPILLRAMLYGLRPERTVEDVKQFLAELTASDRPLIILYEVRGKQYLEIQDFGQRTRTSKFPAPAAAADNCAHLHARASTPQQPTTHTPPTPAPTSQAQQTLWPETAAVVQELHPGADVAPKLAAAASAIVPAITDGELRAALLLTHQGKRQQSAGLWLKTVPAYLRARPAGAAAEKPPELCETCHEPGLCACRKKALAEIVAPKPPGAEVRSMGERTRRGGAT